jgi:hypothetical protein
MTRDARPLMMTLRYRYDASHGRFTALTNAMGRSVSKHTRSSRLMSSIFSPSSAE